MTSTACARAREALRSAAYEEHAIHILQGGPQSVRLIEVNDRDFDTLRRSRLARRLKSRADTLARLRYLLENFLANVAACASDQNHDFAPGGVI